MCTPPIYLCMDFAFLDFTVANPARLLIFARTNSSVLSHRRYYLAKASANEYALDKEHLFVVNGNGNDGGNNRDSRHARDIQIMP